MGQDATATLSEIEAARQRLQRDVDELDRRARPEHDLQEQAQRLGLAAVAAGTGVAAVVALARWRLHARQQHRHARHHAELVADVLEERGLTPGAVVLGGDEDLHREAASGAAMLAAAAAMGAVLARRVGRHR